MRSLMDVIIKTLANTAQTDLNQKASEGSHNWNINGTAGSRCSHDVSRDLFLLFQLCWPLTQLHFQTGNISSCRLPFIKNVVVCMFFFLNVCGSNSKRSKEHMERVTLPPCLPATQLLPLNNQFSQFPGPLSRGVPCTQLSTSLHKWKQII